MRLAKNDDMIQVLPAHRPDQPFAGLCIPLSTLR
jgi:hypothetical protein